MATQLQLRRGTTAENNVFTGAVGELTMDTDTNGLRIHDGSTVGGIQVPTSGTADYVVEWQAPTDLNNYTWYRKYKSGWVEQGGRTDMVSGQNNIALPIAMQNANYTALATRNSGTGATTQIDIWRMIANDTTTTFCVYSGGSTGAIWQVSGMGA